MLFKKISAFNIEMPRDEFNGVIPLNHQVWRESIRSAALVRHFRELTEHQQTGSGWEQPFKALNDEYTIPETEQNLILLCYRSDTRKLAMAGIKEQVQRKVALIEYEETRKVRKIERQTLEDDIVQKILPFTPATPSRTLVLIDTLRRCVLIGSSSDNLASEIRTELSNNLLPAFEVKEETVRPRLLVPVFCQSSAADHMVTWLLDTEEKMAEMPEGMSAGTAVSLQRDKSKNIVVSGQSLDCDTVQNALRDEYKPFKLPVSIMKGDIPMGDITLDVHGCFDSIKISGEFTPIAADVDGNVEDAAFNQILTDMTLTSLNYHYVAGVVHDAFGTLPFGCGADRLREMLDSLGASIELNRPEKVDLDTPQVAPEATSMAEVQSNEFAEAFAKNETNTDDDGLDTLFLSAVHFVSEVKAVSVSGVQRKLRIGYNRAARIVEELEQEGFVSSVNSSGKRKVLCKALELSAPTA